MKAMTKQECKDKVAQFYGETNWWFLLDNGKLSEIVVDDLLDLYARQALIVAAEQAKLADTSSDCEPMIDQSSITGADLTEIQ